MSATPGDTWTDYIPVFIANGFYKNKTEFECRHIIYSRFSKWPKVDRYIDVAKLVSLRSQITVQMHYNKKTISHEKIITVDFDRELFNTLMVGRWNIYEERPVKNISELCFLMRKVVNSDSSRPEAIKELLKEHPKLIVFYNFDYELDILLELGYELGVCTNQWNGHSHEPVPNDETWLYLVQYTAGAEAWECIETNAMAFYSQNYSYKTTIQAAGRIDRNNTEFTDLYYYYLRSVAPIDLAIHKCFRNKQNFNESRFLNV